MVPPNVNTPLRREFPEFAICLMKFFQLTALTNVSIELVSNFEMTLVIE